MKQIYLMLVTILGIFLISLIVPSTVYAANSAGEFQYEEQDTSVSIYAYTGEQLEIIIPSEINEKPVTAIGGYAFLLCPNVEKVVVPASVTKIHANAFTGASNLKEVVLSSSQTVIEPDDSADTPAYEVVVSPQTEVEDNVQANSSAEQQTNASSELADNTEVGGVEDGAGEAAETGSAEETADVNRNAINVPVIAGIVIILIALGAGFIVIRRKSKK